jgi:hypothetical protein
MATVFSAGVIDFDSVWDKARKKAQNPSMLVKDNPFLAESADIPESGYVRRNMQRLRDDQHMRECPHNGHVYAGIMDNMRYGGK